jgi:hypothetical protein
MNAHGVAFCVLISTLKTKAPTVTKTSRGLKRLFGGPEVDGTVAMYFSRQVPNPGMLAKNETVPSQSTLSISSLQYGVTSKRSGAAATPVAKETLVKKTGVAA